jgi:hypothetical protein
LLVCKGYAFVFCSCEDDLRDKISKETVFGLGCFDLLLSGSSEFSNVLIMDIHIRPEKLEDYASSVFGCNGSSIKPPILTIEAPNSYCSRKLFACADRMGPSTQIVVSIVRMEASPRI